MFSRIRIATLSALVCSLFWAGALSLISDEYIKMIDKSEVRVQRYQTLLGEASQMGNQQQRYLEYFASNCINGETFRIGRTEYKCYAQSKVQYNGELLSKQRSL